ncbi:DUF4439 domain-containing protein [Rhodococcus rhodnii]|uniref:DUF4439 domain-containing protein n=2 Tax=Rhodococcus rhodnii TaxID=38312 RepID=R7WL72_9NOCA|nr:ferritin-like domain-containing protein [Rhodococcus rhodnii]EOM76035.1 hypothetical protein Rrhod_2683 [Rhodococcus rhodnii LMG 5362]TXG90869.1 DUF4439 domain-containing protein [Rhodococcus rhodnii]
MTAPTGERPDSGALLDALAAEHGAVFAYGIAGAFANPDRAGAIDADLAAHRATRDATIDLARELGLDPPPAAAGYTMPIEVTDPISAARLAEQVEADCAQAWRATAEAASDERVRTVAIDVLAETAVRRSRWRVVLGDAPATVAFPGQP